ncbi:hypothetical protein CSOJ01_15642 [Colletotrichum sojae]|uniref:Uncharacterized protein n=1 Tax=Colletotrichum sojae TaxID=2175907 RepID=A0A8H6IMR1_9PEZI|nr:hypothetical protein CSOJ01_15642 [Colletotrichum sojae]
MPQIVLADGASSLKDAAGMRGRSLGRSAMAPAVMAGGRGVRRGHGLSAAFLSLFHSLSLALPSTGLFPSGCLTIMARQLPSEPRRLASPELLLSRYGWHLVSTGCQTKRENSGPVIRSHHHLTFLLLLSTSFTVPETRLLDRLALRTCRPGLVWSGLAEHRNSGSGGGSGGGGAWSVYPSDAGGQQPFYYVQTSLLPSPTESTGDQV